MFYIIMDDINRAWHDARFLSIINLLYFIFPDMHVVWPAHWRLNQLQHELLPCIGRFIWIPSVVIIYTKYFSMCNKKEKCECVWQGTEADWLPLPFDLLVNYQSMYASTLIFKVEVKYTRHFPYLLSDFVSKFIGKLQHKFQHL